MSKNRFGISQMNARAQALDEARGLFRRIGGDIRPGEKARWLHRVANKLGWETGRVVSIEYGKDIVAHAHELDALRRAAAEQRRRDIERLRTQLATIEAMRRDNTDAMVHDMRQLLGPLFDRLVSMGVVKVDGVAASKDGEGR